MASVVTSLILVSGCRSASVDNSHGNVLAPGVLGSPPAYKSYPQPGEPYDGGMNQFPSPQPVPPAAIPTPGYSDPEVPPPPSAQKSRWNFRNSSFKLPSLNRQTSEVRQMGAKSDEHGLVTIFRKNKKSASPTLRDTEDVAVDEVVRPRSSTTNNDPVAAVPKLSESEELNAPVYAASNAGKSESNLSSTASSNSAPIRTRYGVVNQWPSARNSTRVPENTNSSGGTSYDIPRLAPPITTNEVPAASNEIPRLLPPSN